jgi:hypothetical protein
MAVPKHRRTSSKKKLKNKKIYFVKNRSLYYNMFLIKKKLEKNEDLNIFNLYNNIIS